MLTLVRQTHASAGAGPVFSPVSVLHLKAAYNKQLAQAKVLGIEWLNHLCVTSARTWTWTVAFPLGATH